jgi:septal ring factor EnvC (AmiA/AmiB activator)
LKIKRSEKKLNEKIYRFLFFVLLGFSLLFAGASVAATVRCITAERELGAVRAELERVRTELANASNQQRELESAITECETIANDTTQLLVQSITTVQGLKEQIHAIRIQFEKMETCLRNYRSSNSTRNCDTSNNSSE